MKKIEELLIEISLKIAKRGEGALFIIGEVEYKPMVEQIVPSFKILDNPKLLESLALIDGAVIIDKEGMMKAYGVKIKSTKILKNYGTRHSAAVSAAIKDNLVILVSEEEKKIKILKKGKVIMQLDALEKNIEKNIDKASIFLESLGAGTFGSLGSAMLIPALGITFLPGVIIFGSAYYLSKLLFKKL